jgi:hypothetical protein
MRPIGIGELFPTPTHDLEVLELQLFGGLQQEPVKLSV